MKPLKLLDASAGRPRLDRYELIAALAAGGMATVYLARVAGAGGFQRFVAIKQLHPHLAHEESFVRMFLDEGRLASGIHHPNVVPILDVGSTQAGYYLVMEYIEGATLWNFRGASKRVEGGSLDLRIAVRACVDTLRGLHAAHELRDDAGELQGLVHRDVSPQNILVGVDGTTRITDFGVARAATRLSSSRAGELKGKLAYMAPEQVLGDELDRRADVFAMGIVTWEILANRFLFLGDGDAHTMRNVLDAPIPKLAEAAPHVPREIAEAVDHALVRDKSRRPPTAAAFADALEAAARGAGALASTQEVAELMTQVLGDGLAARRAAVRDWLQQTGDDSSQPLSDRRSAAALVAPPSGRAPVMLTPVSHPSVPAISSRPSHPSALVATPVAATTRPPASSKTPIAVGVAIALAGLAAGGWAVWTRTDANPSPAPARVSAAEPSRAVPSPSDAASAAPVASATPSASASSAAPRGPVKAASPGGKRGGDDDMSVNPYR